MVSAVVIDFSRFFSRALKRLFSREFVVSADIPTSLNFQICLLYFYVNYVHGSVTSDFAIFNVPMGKPPADDFVSPSEDGRGRWGKRWCMGIFLCMHYLFGSRLYKDKAWVRSSFFF